MEDNSWKQKSVLTKETSLSFFIPDSEVSGLSQLSAFI